MSGYGFFSDPTKDPLFRVCQVDRERAIEAVIRENEPLLQSEALLQLTKFLEYHLNKDLVNVLADEQLVMKVNGAIREHVQDWLERRAQLGWSVFTLKEFLYEAYLDGDKVSFRFPPIYEQLKNGTSVHSFFKPSPWTLHSMAKEWLDKNKATQLVAQVSKETPVAKSNQNIFDFCYRGHELIMTVHQHRYGGGAIALICKMEAVEKTIESIEDQNGETEWELWGLSDSWYPVAYGGTIPEAVERLEKWLEDKIGDWGAIDFGIRRLIEDHVSTRGRQKCKVATMADLHKVHRAWYEDDVETPFF